MATKTCLNRIAELEGTRAKADFVAALPLAVTEADRGKIFFLKSAAGTADEVHVCIKDAADVYVLKQVTLAP